MPIAMTKTNAGTIIQGIYARFDALYSVAFEKAKIYRENIAMELPSGALTEVHAWFDRNMRFRHWNGRRAVQPVVLSAYSLTNEHFENTIGIDRDDIADNQIDSKAPLLRMLGKSAKEFPDLMVFKALQDGTVNLCYDGFPMFCDAHPMAKTTVSNIIPATNGYTGPAWYVMASDTPIRPVIWQLRQAPIFAAQFDMDSPSVFYNKQFEFGVDLRGAAGYGLWQTCVRVEDDMTPENYAAARLLIQSMTYNNGEPMGLVPDLVVCSPYHEGPVIRLLDVQFYDTTTLQTPWYHTAKHAVVPWLANTIVLDPG